MIEYLHGVLRGKSPGSAVVEVNGVGYRLSVSLPTYQDLPEVGEPCMLPTWLNVKKDNGIELFGFGRIEERDMFHLLTSVSSIGPRSALRILSQINTEALRDAIEQQDVGALTHIPGIGKKTAQRLVIELQEKLAPRAAGIGIGGQALEDVRNALVALGYSRSQAQSAVQKLYPKIQEGMDVAELIRQALRYV